MEGAALARTSAGVGASFATPCLPRGAMLDVDASCLPFTKFANGGGDSFSSETSTKPNIKKWSMTCLAKGTHTSSRCRANTGFRLTSRPCRRTTTPEPSSWPSRMARAAWMDGEELYRCEIAIIESEEMRISPGLPASIAFRGSPNRPRCFLVAIVSGSLRFPRLRRSIPDDILRRVFLPRDTTRACGALLHSSAFLTQITVSGTRARA